MRRRPWRRAPGLTEGSQRVSDHPHPVAGAETWKVREPKDLLAAIVEPHADVGVLLARTLAQGGSGHRAACGTHDGSGSAPPSDHVPEETADQRTDHRSACWIRSLLMGGLRDPRDRADPFRGWCDPGTSGGLGRRAGHELHEHHHCRCEVTAQVDLPSSERGTTRRSNHTAARRSSCPKGPSARYPSAGQVPGSTPSGPAHGATRSHPASRATQPVTPAAFS